MKGLSDMKQLVYRALVATLLLVLLTGIVYPLIVTGLVQAICKNQANGSLIMQNGQVVGSRLIGQNFSKPEYFHPRPSAAGNQGYDASSSSGSNLGPTNARLQANVKANLNRVLAENPTATPGQVPVDLVTTSASGIDPHITPASAKLQIARVAKVRGMDEKKLTHLVEQFTEGRQFGLLGEPRVNVLLLNMALDRI